MPQNNEIEVTCSKRDCYWNIDTEKDRYSNNCANGFIELSDGKCLRFITREEAKRRIAEMKPIPPNDEYKIKKSASL